MAEEFPDVPEWISFTKTWHNKPYSFISPERPELSAAGKNVVVAGGGTGIGKATAIAFAQAGAASVAILGRRANRLEEAAQEIRAAGPKTTVLTQGADMSQLTAAEAALKSIASKVGKIHVFVWCVGILPKTAPVLGYDEQEFRRGFELMVMSAFNAIQAVVPVAASDAKLINVSSGIAHINPMPGLFNYAMYKLAVVKMFDYLAAENPELHVVNTQPGVIRTEINSDTDVEGQDEIELPASFHVWLASPEAAFLKGKYVWVNWDAEELVSRKDEIKDSMLCRVLLAGMPM
ncbi:hypothetical protein M409DRAFT_65252 [Zasmidium cellare ATCC 36951]|uniref:Uncharacterized protein n=1 Tax=Zasmidium cellare ATCC 36951 TaxID=1080233 RepID=A0A6A6CP63_ZASCE|nr:uncharacterized protein M409DRAFT_65252 [Zasmidium cellare ATCC 36951]KAF2168895.1 hypothetical protein M409DRAFT_65252 [Zasmidium cellare ATCC 36951]